VGRVRADDRREHRRRTSVRRRGAGGHDGLGEQGLARAPRLAGGRVGHGAARAPTVQDRRHRAHTALSSARPALATASALALGPRAFRDRACAALLGGLHTRYHLQYGAARRSRTDLDANVLIYTHNQHFSNPDAAETHTDHHRMVVHLLYCYSLRRIQYRFHCTHKYQMHCESSAPISTCPFSCTPAGPSDSDATMKVRASAAVSYRDTKLRLAVCRL
jgi:hypothetical protein